MPPLRDRALTKLYANFTKFSRFLVNGTILFPLNTLQRDSKGGIQPSFAIVLDWGGAVIADPFVTPECRMTDPLSTREPLLAEPKIIFVIGMHRSGTSVLAHAINLMGAFVGDDRELVPPDPSINPTGYWERADIVAEHDRFLRSNGFAWATVANFAIEHVDEERRRAHAGALRGIVDGMLHAGSTLVIKDPRLCLLLPVWNEFVEAPAYVVAVRDPRKVAASLMAAFPNSFTTDFLLALWQKYMQSALSALAGKRVLFVSYARMLRDGEAEYRRLRAGLSELGVPGLSAFNEDGLHGLLDGRLDRSKPSPHARLDEDQQRLFDWLLRRCESRGLVDVTDLPAMPSPDSILCELEKVRAACMRNGWNMATRREAAAVQSLMAHTA